MKKVVLILILLQFNIIIGQEIAPEKIRIIKEPKLEFVNLKSASDVFSFRFWNKGQVIDIRKISDSTTTGSIINFVTEGSDSYATQRKIQQGKIIPDIYLQKITLSKKEIENVLEIIDKYKVIDLATCDSIKDWEPVLDGEWFSIEQKVQGDYIEKSYGNPKSQTIPEAKIFLKFYSDLEKTLNLNKIFWKFFGQLNVGCYTRNGEHELICKQKKR